MGEHQKAETLENSNIGTLLMLLVSVVLVLEVALVLVLVLVLALVLVLVSSLRYFVNYSIGSS